MSLTSHPDPVDILSFKVSAIQGDVSPLLGDHILDSVINLLSIEYGQEHLPAGDCLIIQKDLKTQNQKICISFLFIRPV
jgi:hypothetical protein